MDLSTLIERKYSERDYYRKNEFKKRRETIVFLHGLTGHSGVWKNYLLHFEKKFNVIAPDFVGHGRSHRPYDFSRYSPKVLAVELSNILREEKIESAHFVVHSYALLVFSELLKINKKVVKSAVVISPYFPNRKTWKWKISRFLSILIAPLVYVLPTKKKYGLVNYEEEGITSDINLKRVISDTLKTGFKSYIALNYHSLKYKNDHFLSQITFPTLLISGGLDKIIPVGDVKEIASKIANSKLIILENNAHVLVYPYYYTIIPLIEQFIKAPETIYTEQERH